MKKAGKITGQKIAKVPGSYISIQEKLKLVKENTIFLIVKRKKKLKISANIGKKLISLIVHIKFETHVRFIYKKDNSFTYMSR